MKKLSSVLLALGIIIIVGSIILSLLIFQSVFKEELNYSLKKISGAQNKTITPIDKSFGIVIKKIGANAKIIQGVDPFNSVIYQTALTKGIAHALGTSLPGETGNVFLFSHSSSDFFQAQKYNSVFYLLDKLENGDEIEVYYKNQKFTYKVSDKKIASANDIQYLKGDSENKTLTLMTCWPAGTSLKRLLVIAELKMQVVQ